jgi:hypothetical protein
LSVIVDSLDFLQKTKKSDVLNFRIYRGKFSVTQDEFSKIFSQDNEDFIKAGKGSQISLGQFLHKFHQNFPDDGEIVCKDRLAGDTVSFSLHHLAKDCQLRYRLTVLKAAILSGRLIEFDVCTNLCICVW